LTCAICGGSAGETWLEGIPDHEYALPFVTTLVRCAACNVVQQHPLPAPEDLSAFYPSDYHAYQYHDSPVADRLKTRYSQRVGRRIRALIPADGAILDLGCADGSFLAALEPLGDWELHGLDINPEIIRRPRSPRLELRAGQLGPDTYPRERFDAIVASHLVEHVCDPVELMRVCERILRPGGILIGELPNLASWDARLFGRYWGGLHQPRHLFFWDRASFLDLGRRGGFAAVRTFPLLQPAHWAISVQNLLLARFPRLRRFARRGRLPLYTAAVLAATPLCMLQNLAGAPSIMGFLFQKPPIQRALPRDPRPGRDRERPDPAGDREVNETS